MHSRLPAAHGHSLLGELQQCNGQDGVVCAWQAAQLKAIALRVREKFTTTPADSSTWARRHAEQDPLDEAGGAFQDLAPQQLPAAMPSLDYQLMWKSTRDKDGNAVSVWRPVGPPGFKPVGDVAVVGFDKPLEPVQVSACQLGLIGHSCSSQALLQGTLCEWETLQPAVNLAYTALSARVLRQGTMTSITIASAAAPMHAS